MKTILRHINLLNILLLSIILFFAAYILMPMFTINFRSVLPEPKGKDTGQFDLQTDFLTPAPPDYLMIADDNLFHPERKIPEEESGQEDTQSKPEFVLYGTLITDEESFAFIEDVKSPRSTAGRGQRQTTLKMGASLSGYVLKDLDPEKVTMTRGDDKIIVHVFDSNKPKARHSAPVALQEKSQSPATAPVARTPAARQAAREAARAKRRVTNPGQLVKPSPPPTMRAPITEGDRRALDFFKR